MIAVFAGLRLEVQRFLRRLDVQDRTRLGGFPVTLGEYRGRPLLVCHMGMGQRAAQAAAAVLGRYRPEFVLSVGLAGALSPERAVGDLVFCERVYRAEPGSEAGVAAEPVLSDPLLLETARRAASGRGLSTCIGSSLTTSYVVAEPQQKALLRRTTGMDVVEMESYWVGRAALEHGLPFLAARVVLDELGDRLPELPGVVESDGSRRTLRALPYLLRRAGQLPSLLRTGASERRALGTLTRFLEASIGALETSPLTEPV